MVAAAAAYTMRCKRTSQPCLYTNNTVIRSHEARLTVTLIFGMWALYPHF